MKKEDLFDTLSSIHEDYIVDAHAESAGKGSPAWVRWGTLAACLAAICIISIPVIRHRSPDAASQLANPESATTTTTTNKTTNEEPEPQKEYNLAANSESSQNERSVHAEEFSGDKEESEAIISESNPDEISSTASEDTPADRNNEYLEAVNSSDLSKTSSEYFGGSYLDDAGHFVIVLTEDTPEHRSSICRELNREEGNTVFVPGTYTLEYLTAVQEAISTAMSNKELPFVTASGLYETQNRIIVSVTTTDESDLAKVYAFDTIGGAIMIENSSGATTDICVNVEDFGEDVEDLEISIPKTE